MGRDLTHSVQSKKIIQIDCESSNDGQNTLNKPLDYYIESE